ncbi:hypothetical protein EON65_39350 [archaeon]|nr:MAG: hypothetical protein EON65_39350 [archaeon]
METTSYHTRSTQDRSTATELAQTAAAQDIAHISARTARNMLHDEGLKPMHTIRKPLLTRAHKRKRLDFALTKHDWTVQQWKQVIFSDETSTSRVYSKCGIIFSFLSYLCHICRTSYVTRNMPLCDGGHFETFLVAINNAILPRFSQLKIIPTQRQAQQCGIPLKHGI